ncbi:hypothetical protein GCM10027161_27250 [Microbispora hainanensis]
MYGSRWVPLHATVEGWVESVALTYHASSYAKKIVKVTADEVEAIRLEEHEPVLEVAGLADS